MLSISDEDIRERINRDNPWWVADASVPEWTFQRRTYFRPFAALALNRGIRRAAVLLGPRRVGKTVLIKQIVREAIDRGIDPCRILYASIDTPIYSGMRLEAFVRMLPGTDDDALMIFDEIQYLKDWERHLKDLVDTYPRIKFVATGSAAAALRLKSRESGAGRFSEFMLPPLTFHEFLCFIGQDADLVSEGPDGEYLFGDIDRLNAAFIDYLNYGGYPEAVLNPDIRRDPDQFVRNDIIDKVLLKDLPALYGINDIQELNRLFSFLAYNTGNEASLEKISQESGLAKPTIKKYIEYLESAFLILKIQTVDQNGRTMQRERNFKIYLNNPSMRAALFTPVKADEHDLIGRLAESAIYSQWQHSSTSRSLRYARWKEGEVDIVCLDARMKPWWAVELKWSDRVARQTTERAALRTFIANNKSIETCQMTTRTIDTIVTIDRLAVRLQPTAAYCYTIGRNLRHAADPEAIGPHPRQPPEPEDEPVAVDEPMLDL
jgi:predicted AAA+ superfamily ATPase